MTDDAVTPDPSKSYARSFPGYKPDDPVKREAERAASDRLWARLVADDEAQEAQKAAEPVELPERVEDWSFDDRQAYEELSLVPGTGRTVESKAAAEDVVRSWHREGWPARCDRIRDERIGHRPRRLNS